MLTDTALDTQTLTLIQLVPTAPAQVYRMFTNAMSFREWLCDASQVDAREGGALFLSWNAGYFAAGRYLTLKPDEQIIFTWQGENEPGVTRVEVTLEKQDDGTQVTLTHSGIGVGEGWDAGGVRRNWAEALENLAAHFETGLDQRLMRRPMLGIMLSFLDASAVARLKLPTDKGILLSDVMDGLGAKAAGLQRDDVIVSMGGKLTPDFPSVGAVMSTHKAGDSIPVEYYRDGEKHTVSMTLSGRPAPDVPPTPAELADQMERFYTELNGELDAALQGVTEAEASRKPSPTDWSVKEVLAHLIWSERWKQKVAFGIVGGDDNVAWQDNAPMHLATVLGGYNTLPDLVDALKRAEAATVETARSIPADFMTRKGSYLRVGQFLLNFPAHTRNHIQQIKDAVAAAREAK